MLLVTGATGRSGRFFVEALVDNAYSGRIRCVVRSTSDTAFLEGCGLDIELVVGDLDDPGFVDRCMEGVDELLHIASIFLSLQVVTAAAKRNVRRAILVHTTGIYSSYKSASEEYTRIESAIAEVTREHPGLGVVYLRPTMIYGSVSDGNMVTFIKLVDRLPVMPVVDRGRGLVQPVHQRDLGRAYQQVLANPEITEGDFILSGESPVALREVLELIRSELGRRTRFVSVPLGVGVALARVIRVLTAGRVDYVEKVQRMGEDRSFPHDAATAAFGYTPSSLRAGLRAEVAEYAGNGGGSSVVTEVGRGRGVA
ncbi:NAD-dependent epimerase/dehydratase family protein [Pedococcus sp. P5_B7]